MHTKTSPHHSFHWAAFLSMLVCGCAAGADLDAGRGDDSGVTGPTDAGPLDGGVDAGSTDAGSTDAGPTDAGLTDAGSTDAGPTDAGPTDAGSTDAGPPVATLHQLAVGASTWSVSPASDAFSGSVAPRVEDIQTAWSICDFGMICIGTATRWHCTTDLLTWRSATWTATVGAAPSFTAPTFTIATRERSGVDRRIFLSAGADWWQFTYDTAPVDGAWAITLETHFMDSTPTPARMDHDVEWGMDANAPNEAARIVADWIDEETTGDARWNLVRDDGFRYQFFVSADGTVGTWETPGSEPRLALPGAPSIGRTVAMLADCAGTLFAIQRP